MQTVRPFSDPLREAWHYFPMRRDGVMLKDLSPVQKAALQALLATVLTQAGLERARGVVTLEGVLAELTGQAGFRDAGRYHTLIFGTPSETGHWGLRFEGHHLSLNYTFVNGQTHTAIAPAFFGANPHVVPRGEHRGLRVLGQEEDQARALMLGLTQAQQAQALIADRAPRDILTGADRVAKLQSPPGLPAHQLDHTQQHALRSLINLYLNNHRPQAAEAMRARIQEVGFDRVHFAWAGSTAPGMPHYYRVQGPSFLIEYDNIQGGANHSHTVLRDLENDFGRDWLKEHHLRAH